MYILYFSFNNKILYVIFFCTSQRVRDDIEKKIQILFFILLYGWHCQKKNIIDVVANMFIVSAKDDEKK
jgi:hypothetical protein